VTRPAKPATVRFYFDADVLGLAKAVVRLRSDSTYPRDPGGVVHKRQRPPCPITSAAGLDRDWIPEVARQGWVFITRDRHIRDHRAEIGAVREHRAKMVTLAAEDARGRWNQLEVLMCQWRPIERVVDEPGPFIYRATRTALTLQELVDAPRGP
jgi:PIN like domain